LTAEVPYQLPYNVTSILSNGPIPRIRTNRNPYARSRPMFPTAKKVAFRAPLTEEIKTTKYTTAHSELELPSSTIDTTEAPEEDRRDEQGASEQSKPAVTKRVARGLVLTLPQSVEKRESSDEEDEDNDACPATPVAGRRKKSRVWQWTLGPIDGAPQQSRPDEVGLGEEKTEGT